MQLLAGCNMWAVFWPPSLSPVEPWAHRPELGAGPDTAVDVIYDERYVPHIRAKTRDDAAYALGFLHARDRLFQLQVLKFAAWGRLGEIFGESLLDTDRELRLVSWNIAAEEKVMDPEARALTEAYARGVNEGAAHAGRSVEMQILGVAHSPFEVKDVLAIARLQSWQLSFDFLAELARARVLERLPAGDERRAALLEDVPSRGVAIVEDSAASVSRGLPLPNESAPSSPPTAPPPSPSPADEPSTAPVDPAPPPAGGAARSDESDVAPRWYEAASGASNSWVVSGRMTTTGKPVLCNDPHLTHRSPSVWYMVHIQLPDTNVIGGTLVGLPAVMIGAGEHVAWGLTTPYADTQDLVRIEVSSDAPDSYIVDGQRVRFQRHTERFMAGGDVLRTEVWRSTRFGPVLPSVFASNMEPGQTYALMWTGFDPSAAPRQLLGAWDLAKARDLEEATAALELFAATQNVVLAFDDGSIGYRLMGRVPHRLSTEPTWQPRDGKTAAAGWGGYLAARDKPALENPASGYIVTANQRVVTGNHSAAPAIGGYAAPPHRAQRIHERIGELTKDDRKVKPEELLAIQQDVVSIEARALAPLLGEACPTSGVTGYSQSTVEAFCRRVRAFDGAYTTSSDGALPFTVLYEQVQTEIIAAHLGSDVVPQLLRARNITMAIEEAILAEARGELSPLLDDRRTKAREGLRGFVVRAADEAIGRVIEHGGARPEGWRWGNVHKLGAQSPLARAPIIGGLFRDKPRAMAGWKSAPRAEAGMPVRHGATLRFLAQPGSEEAPRIVGELGNSGHRGHPHAKDWMDEWDLAQPFVISTDEASIEKAAQGRLRLLPR